MYAFRGGGFLALLLIAACVPYYLLHNIVKRDLRISELAQSDGTAGSGWTQEADAFSWSTLEPSNQLIWRNCFGAYQCARLIVPLNYSEPNGNNATIALARIPSPLPTSSPWYRGPILINPGGPGGSGVATIITSGGLLSAIVGPQFDVVGFDPRGIGYSTPRMSFFETEVERELWGNEGLSVLNVTKDGIARAYARAQIFGQLAAERQLDELKHINTDHTARDMLRITEAHGMEKLQYWGFSYGSVLGATFAAMFPEKVGRIVIDGVVDAENYYAALWSNNLMDTDKTLQAFFDQCAAVGPARCPFYAPTSDDIARNLTSLYDAVRIRPVPVRTSTSYGLIDYSRLRVTVFSVLYKPFANFLPLASALADLAAGDGTRLFQLLQTPPFQCSCDGASFRHAVRDAQVTIACNDGDLVPSSLEEFQKYFDESSRFSGWTELWAGIRAGCIGWPRLPKTHFRGPFIGNTSFPLLLVGNTADPVTPLWAAKKMSKGFMNSVVLTQDSPGHCSIAAPSLCTQKYIRGYFVEGILPPPDTVCPVNGSPFPEVYPTTSGDQAIFKLQENLTAADLHLLDVVRKLSESFSVPFPL